MEGWYVFRVRFGLATSDVDATPDTFETVVRLPAAPPGDEEEAWRFFEEWLWRGELTDEGRFRPVVEEWLSVPVHAVQFSELVGDEAYHEAWADAVSDEVDRYNAETVRAVRHQHLGSSVRVVGDADDGDQPPE
jgi:hypothetical protein